MGGRYPHMLLILILLHGANAAVDEPVQKWQTLDGNPPLVIARGGFSGLFPESSPAAYQFAMATGLPEVVLYCDLQLSSDGIGICRSGLKLDKSTLISEVFPKRDKTYKLGNEDVHGWFLLDFTADELLNNVTGDSTPASASNDACGLHFYYSKGVHTKRTAHGSHEVDTCINHLNKQADPVHQHDDILSKSQPHRMNKSCATISIRLHL